MKLQATTCCSSLQPLLLQASDVVTGERQEKKLQALDRRVGVDKRGYQGVKPVQADQRSLVRFQPNLASLTRLV